MKSLLNFALLLLLFVGLSLTIPGLFKHVPFLVLPLLGILAVLLMRQSLLMPLGQTADPPPE
ncbi:MAG: hypothetical protein AB7I41_16470 [Candidatus Sericytochromatia bacterium]